MSQLYEHAVNEAFGAIVAQALTTELEETVIHASVIEHDEGLTVILKFADGRVVTMHVALHILQEDPCGVWERIALAYQSDSSYGLHNIV